MTETLPRSLNGISVLVPQLQGHGTHDAGLYEDFLDAFLYRTLAARSGAFIDVGVNLGQILLKVVTKSPGRPYVGFEPSSFCSVYLGHLIEANELTNCQVFPLALSDRTGFLEFFYTDEADERATTVPGFWGAEHVRQKVKRIACFRGDDAMAGLKPGRVGIIKIDVEGAELAVLKGFEKTIRADRPIILVEILPHTVDDEETGLQGDRDVSETRKLRIEALLAFAAELGYACRLIRADGTLSATTAFRVASYDPALANYALVPMEGDGSLTAAFA